MCLQSQNVVCWQQSTCVSNRKILFIDNKAFDNVIVHNIIDYFIVRVGFAAYHYIICWSYNAMCTKMACVWWNTIWNVVAQNVTMCNCASVNIYFIKNIQIVWCMLSITELMSTHLALLSANETKSKHCKLLNLICSKTLRDPQKVPT